MVIPSTSRALSYLLFSSAPPSSKLSPLFKIPRFPSLSLHRPFSSASPYPLYYELIRHRPAGPTLPTSPHRRPAAASLEATEEPSDGDRRESMDRSKRKYYRKRQKRMYGGSDSESDGGRGSRDEGYVELQPEIVDFPRLHAREQELYFYDAFAFPWEKEKHYRMVYQLEKKYFPEQCLDKAFVDPGAAESMKASSLAEGNIKRKRGKREEEKDERALVFFEDEKDRPAAAERGVSEKKVEDFFKCLKKVPNANGPRIASPMEDEGEPYLAMRRTQLPPRWDGPSGTVVLVDKPKGWTSFTVCGKLRRLVKVQKVGHAGTLDPMATGLLIVCVGKSTKLVERYQGMVKDYSGIFRLGEATSTWDADSPVIQREPWEHIRDEDIKKTAASFLGEIWQVPPMFSAIKGCQATHQQKCQTPDDLHLSTCEPAGTPYVKVGGEKMYEKARRGETIELSPRRISIFQFDIERSLDDRQNLIFRVTCSKGTYIRSLCADLGKALGSCAHLIALRRDSIGQYSADDAWNFQELEEQITKGYF